MLLTPRLRITSDFLCADTLQGSRDYGFGATDRLNHFLRHDTLEPTQEVASHPGHGKIIVSDPLNMFERSLCSLSIIAFACDAEAAQLMATTKLLPCIAHGQSVSPERLHAKTMRASLISLHAPHSPRNFHVFDAKSLDTPR